MCKSQVNQEELQKVFEKYSTHVEYIGAPIEDVNTQSILGDNLLHTSARKGDIESMKILIEAGIDVNHKGDMNYTPLHYAAGWGGVEAVQLLLEHGADKNALNDFKKNPKQTAEGRGMLKTSKLL